MYATAERRMIMSIKCLMNGLEVNYPCSPVCALFGDCVTAFEAQKKENVRTNADRIRAMTDEQLAEFIRRMVDGSNTHEVACYGCIHYGTHHSDPENKGTDLYECDGCRSEGIGLDVLKWLRLPAREAHKGEGGGDNA